MDSVFSWFLVNPARAMVTISIFLTLSVGWAEYGGRSSGGSGWLTLARMSIGLVWTVATAVVAAIFGGVGAFFGYLALQALICIVTPMLLVEAM